MSIRRLIPLFVAAFTMSMSVVTFRVVEAQPIPPLYHPRDKDAWDFWYVRQGDTFYTFYLQAPEYDPDRFAHATVGLATSTDLSHWTEYGTVLDKGAPGSWDDQSVATGSSWKVGGHWMMVYTGHGTNNFRGLGVATSNDLKHWTRVGDGLAPIVYHGFRVPASPYWQNNGFPADTTLTYEFLDDAYVYPEPINGWYYMVANCILANEPVDTRGCIGMFRSQDGLAWDDVGLVEATRTYAELEVPEIWKHGDRWYLMHGIARFNPRIRGTVVRTSDSFFGPFEPTPQAELQVPNFTQGFYLGKVVSDRQGEDVVLVNTGIAVSRPFPVVYESDGSLTILPYRTAPTNWLPTGLTSFRGGVVSDGTGGVISNGSARIDPGGHAVWTTTAPPAGVSWVSDGRGGAAGTYASGGDIVGLRTTLAGVRRWGSGASVCSAPQAQIAPVIASDGVGGAFFAWADYRSGTNFDIYAQHLDSLGQATWTANGVALCTAAGNQIDEVIAPDGAGGAIVAWYDQRPGSIGGGDVYAQRVNSAGVRQWGTNGVAVAAAAGLQQAPAIESDGAGGAYVAWWDRRGADDDIYLQRMNAAGTPVWAANGAPVADAIFDQHLPVLLRDGTNGVYVAWEDHRSTGPNGLDIYAQRVAPTGEKLWTASGIAVCIEVSQQTRPSIVADGMGGIIIGWKDARNDTSQTVYTFDPYVQRLDSNGIPQWTADGARVEPAGSTTSTGLVSIAPDGTGGVFVDGNNGLARVLPDGRPAWVPNFTPTIESVSDAPADEGGLVRLLVDAAVVEGGAVPTPIVGYQVWRRSPGTLYGGPPNGWDLLLAFPPMGLTSFTLLAPTLTDSTAAGAADDIYVVSATTSNPTMLLPSGSMSGHSVDNLAPGAPANLAGARGGPAVVQLSWDARPEPDVTYYRVYRGSSAGFPLSPANRIGQPVTTAWTDTAFVVGVSHYKVTAVDRHGNESAAASIGPGQITPPPSERPSVTCLAGAAPNPFILSTMIGYGLARSGRVSLGIYDLFGRRVRTLVEGTVPAGDRFARWDAHDDHGSRLGPGLYFVRLVTDGLVRAEKIAIAN